MPVRGVGGAVRRARPLLHLGVVRRRHGQPRLRGEPDEERLRERRALDRIRARGELVDAARASARWPRRGSATRLRTWPEKVERLISIDCWSPMSASTRSNTGNVASTAGGREPGLVQQRGEAERLQRHRLAARVRAADHEHAQAAELEVDRHRRRRGRAAGGARRAAARRPRSSPARRASGGRGSPRASGEVELAGRLDERAQRLGRASPTCADSSRRIRSTSSRSAPAASESRLLSSTTANGSTKSVWPELEESWTMPGTFERALAFTASTGRPPRSVTNSSWRWSRSPPSARARRSSSAAR